MKWLLRKVDSVIHRFISHPPCAKTHIDVTYPLVWTNTSTANANPAAYTYFNVKS